MLGVVVGVYGLSCSVMVSVVKGLWVVVIGCQSMDGESVVVCVAVFTRAGGAGCVLILPGFSLSLGFSIGRGLPGCCSSLEVCVWLQHSWCTCLGLIPCCARDSPLGGVAVLDCLASVWLATFGNVAS